MSEILNRLDEAGENLIDDHGAKMFDDLITEGRDIAEEELPEELRGPAGAAIDALAEVKKPSLRLTKIGLTRIVGLLASDKEHEARLVYIATEATYAERRSFLQASGDRAETIAKEKEESWDELKAGLLEVGKVALKALGVVLLAALGI